jgi:hypothetical protein
MALLRAFAAPRACRPLSDCGLGLGFTSSRIVTIAAVTIKAAPAARRFAVKEP